MFIPKKFQSASLASRTFLAQIQSNHREEKEQKAQELARAVQEATFKQLQTQIEGDMAILREKLGSSQDQAVETAKDLKYVRERQMQLGIIAGKLLGFHSILPLGVLSFKPSGDMHYPTSLAVRKGKAYVEKWMQEKCHMLRLPDEKDLNVMFPDIMKYMETFRGISGPSILFSFLRGGNVSEASLMISTLL